jgi:hypothetical protein
MTRITARRVIAVLSVAATLMVSGVLSASTASAGLDDVPFARVQVRSLTLDGYTGNVLVVARVRCEQKIDGVGTASWSVNVVQDLKAKAKGSIECDGVRHRAVLLLDPKRGRFAPGAVNVTITVIRQGSKFAEVESASFDAVV